jgi:hypothetical protein
MYSPESAEFKDRQYVPHAFQNYKCRLVNNQGCFRTRKTLDVTFENHHKTVTTPNQVTNRKRGRQRNWWISLNHVLTPLARLGREPSPLPAAPDSAIREL